jgi:hypothetical protein
MENLSSLELSALVDLLASNTQKYTQMLSEGGDQSEFETCKLAIAALQKEIEFRKQSFNDSTSSTTPPDFT